MSSTQGFPSNLLGSALIGAVFNAWCVLLVLMPDYFSWIRLHCGRIVGLICMQAYNYYSKFPKDRIILKLLVIFLMVRDTPEADCLPGCLDIVGPPLCCIRKAHMPYLPTKGDSNFQCVSYSDNVRASNTNAEGFEALSRQPCSTITWSMTLVSLQTWLIQTGEGLLG